MKWSFVVEVENLENLGGLRDIVERRAEEVVAVLGGTVGTGKKATYAVRATFYQKKDRLLQNNPLIPREDRGDLDTLLEHVFNGLGPIIGYRRDYINPGPGGALDASITEVRAQKVNNCSDKEFLGVEVELLHVSEANE